jgi:tRNA-Thr(GGU) m(6)t(6)A37 methyltransferase TsaA
MDMKIVPIGTVKNSIKEPHTGDGETIVSEILIKKKYQPALDQIEGFSHIIVLYWMDRLSPSKRSILKVHPRGRQDLPLVGVFASRSQARPNPIGLTTVKVLEHHDNIIKVMGLDAIDGTPVLDIKPHIPGHDSPAKAKTPDWMKKLRE